ncbi:enoyl-CoA hydratase [Steroidobacter denitrificans]|uniref:Enoyl-CoA hydratase n=1 Tax=Steroidobacter denitrificans TaxID=465721 RepID=A0A127F6X1_STEDE|nr:enoyl-CoA hydratase [Steroidobacter denitrificans]
MLLVEKSGAVAILTLNRPDAMNALSIGLRCAFSQVFRDIQADPLIRVAILTGAGRAFCGGMDLKELAGGMNQTGDGDAASGWDMMDAMAAFEGPIIGAINGPAITAGFELALGCDLIIASSEAMFADTHVRVGMLPGWGLSQRLPRLIGIARAKELSFTGNFLTAERACEWGLVNRVVAAADLLPVCRSLAAEMASTVPELLKAYKKLIDDGYGMPLAEAMGYERSLALAYARTVSPAVIATRRTSVQARGRMLSKDETD